MPDAVLLGGADVGAETAAQVKVNRGGAEGVGGELAVRVAQLVHASAAGGEERAGQAAALMRGIDGDPVDAAPGSLARFVDEPGGGGGDGRAGGVFEEEDAVLQDLGVVAELVVKDGGGVAVGVVGVVPDAAPGFGVTGDIGAKGQAGRQGQVWIGGQVVVDHPELDAAGVVGHGWLWWAARW